MKRTTKDGDRITEDEHKLIVKKDQCPDCRRTGFLAGPRGGGCQNFKCANVDCGSRFNNMALFGIERISDPSPDKPEPPPPIFWGYR